MYLGCLGVQWTGMACSLQQRSSGCSRWVRGSCSNRVVPDQTDHTRSVLYLQLQLSQRGSGSVSLSLSWSMTHIVAHAPTICMMLCVCALLLLYKVECTVLECEVFVSTVPMSSALGLSAIDSLVQHPLHPDTMFYSDYHGSAVHVWNTSSGEGHQTSTAMNCLHCFRNHGIIFCKELEML